MLKNLVNITFFLFIFDVFNRTFIMFIDTRYILFFLYIMLFFIKLLQLLKYKHINIFGTRKSIFLILVFFSLIFISNLMWFVNPYKPNLEILFNAVILYIFYIFSFFIFILYWPYIKIKNISKYVLFSGIILWLSMFIELLGFKLPFCIESYKGVAEISFFGIRVGGYAQDPNYASLLMLIWFFILNFLGIKGIKKLIVFILSIIGFLMSFSKTLILAYFFLFTLYIAKKLRLLVAYITFILFLSFFIGYYFYELLNTLSTMSQRFSFWKAALSDVFSSPFFGHGITSVRSHFEYIGGWYVQPHNSFVAMIYDNGIIALFIYLIIYYKLLKYIKDINYFFIIGLLFFLSFTQELFVFPFPYFILGVLPIIFLIKQQKIYCTRIKI